MMFFQVNHSLWLREKSSWTWVITEQDGKIIAAHCICMAGLGKPCSHVGALLFAIEAAVKIRNSVTVTSIKQTHPLLITSISEYFVYHNALRARGTRQNGDVFWDRGTRNGLCAHLCYHLVSHHCNHIIVHKIVYTSAAMFVTKHWQT